jgi:tRNA dimethylallyltransferase
METEKQPLPKVVVVVGPTACGKTNWSLRLAQKHGGEIISADSRQIFRKMNIGTAKEPGEWRRNGLRRTYYIQDVPHHLIDFLDPGKRFSMAEFRDKAVKYVKLAHQNKRLPIVAGGTGLYVAGLVDNLKIPRVEPNYKLRRSLEEKSLDELMVLLKNLDPVAVDNIDQKNKRRIIRALEVCIFTGEPFSEQRERGEPLFDFLQIGIETSRDVLYERINARVDQMMKLGLLKEIEILLKQKYSWELPSLSGIGYRQFQDYFDQKCPLDEAIERLKRDTRRYARKQLSWFRRDKRIVWLKDYTEAEKIVEEFLGNVN